MSNGLECSWHDGDVFELKTAASDPSDPTGRGVVFGCLPRAALRLPWAIIFASLREASVVQDREASVVNDWEAFVD